MRLSGWILIICFAMMFIACSRKPVFQVNYSLPQAAAAYPDKQVYVSASDGRSVTQFATPAAARELKDFSGLFSLVVLKSENVGDLVGAFEIIPLKPGCIAHPPGNRTEILPARLCRPQMAGRYEL